MPPHMRWSRPKYCGRTFQMKRFIRRREWWQPEHKTDTRFAAPAQWRRSPLRCHSQSPDITSPPTLLNLQSSLVFYLQLVLPPPAGHRHLSPFPETSFHSEIIIVLIVNKIIAPLLPVNVNSLSGNEGTWEPSDAVRSPIIH